MTTTTLRALLASLLTMALLLGACTRPSVNPEAEALPSTLEVIIEGLPADVPADITITNLTVTYEVTVNTILADLVAGRYAVETAPTTDDATGIVYLPEPTRVVVDIPETEAVTVRYSPACSNDVRDAREECASLSGYAQGYVTQRVTQNSGLLEVRATLQVLTSDGTTYQALPIGSATTDASYFTLALPPTLSTLQMDSIENVMRALSFEEQGCVRSVTITNRNARGNDLFLDIYDVPVLADDALEGVDDEEFSQSDDRRGELFLFNQSDNELVLWIYSNAATAVFGSEDCAELGRLTFDLELEVGWNLVSLTFDDMAGSGAEGVTITRREGFSGNAGRSFMVMPADYDEMSDPNDPIISVFPDDFAELNTRPFGFINLPLNEFGMVQTPFSNNPMVALAVSSNPGAEATSLPFSPIAVSTFEKAQQTMWSLQNAALTSRMNERLEDGGYARLRPFILNPVDENNQPFCSKPLTVASGPAAPVYNTLNFEILTGADNRFSGYANLMYNSTIASWWYSPDAFRVEDSHNCDGQLELTKIRYDYRLDLQPGWNVVYTTIVPQNADEFADDDGFTYLDAVITTAVPTEVPFLYWRTTPDLTRDALPADSTLPDGGSQANVIRGGVPLCDPDLPTCALSDLLDAGAELNLITSLGHALRSGNSTVAGVTITNNGDFTIGLPGSVDPAIEIISGNELLIEIDQPSFASDLVLPDASVFRGVLDAECGTRVAPLSTSDTYVVRTSLYFRGADNSNMGTANLRGNSDSGRTNHVVEWMYASEAMRIAWTSSNGGCEFSPLDGTSAIDNRAVTLAIDLNLAQGWNMVHRTSTNPLNANEPLTFTWRVIDQVPAVVSWYADVSIVSAGGVAASLGIGEEAFTALLNRVSVSAHTAPLSVVGERAGRALLRALIDGRR